MKLKFRGKFFLIATIIILLFASISIIVSYKEISNLVKETTSSKINSVENMAFRYIDEKYDGSWSIEGDKLLKGRHDISNDFALVDKIKKDSGIEITIFKGDTRLITTIMKNGKRAVGTKADSKVIRTTLKGGKIYKGEVEILNNKFDVKYVPIKNDNGKVIAMFFAGFSKQAMINQTNDFLRNMILVTLIVVTIALIIAMIFTRHFAKPLERLAKQLSIISKGDFTSNMCEVYKKRSDEIGDISKSIKYMQDALKRSIKELKEEFNKVNSNSDNLAVISEQMAEASDTVATTIQDVAKGTSSQAEELAQINHVFDEFGKQIIKISAEVQSVTESTDAINNLANSSEQSMLNLRKSINDIENMIKEFIDKIYKLDGEMGKINEITIAINSIADQTNLLALNAAIEAARAGEHGRGFGVVAEEIRKLSEQVKSSSTEINDVLVGITGDTEQIVNNSGKIDDEINSQSQTVKIAMESFGKIIIAVNDVTPKIENVNNSTNMIDKRKNEILQKVEAAASVAQEVAASSEEVSATSEELNASAEEVTGSAEELRGFSENMFACVKKFKID